METQEDIDVGVNVWVSSPTLGEFRDQLSLSFERLTPQSDEPVGAGELVQLSKFVTNAITKHLNADPAYDIIDLLVNSFDGEVAALASSASEFILKAVITHTINETTNDMIENLQNQFESEYDTLATIADEIKQAITDISFEAPFECVDITILNDDIAIAKIRYLL